MPTRLLDLGNSNEKTWRICQNPTYVPYIALSHRWSPDTPTLRTSNCQKYRNFQPDSVLPQSYRDILSICRAIPIRYLWVDSLCIIQDDGGSEFEKEALLMTDIYQYAFLTLTICWDFPGLSVFRKCRPRSIPRLKAPPPYAQHAVSQEDECVFIKHGRSEELKVDVHDAPINHRAWVLQERCLSRRVLYLGNEQLYWECDGCTGSEVSPLALYKDYERQSILDLTGPDRDLSWTRILTKYTGCDLTFEQDRLIAIAGLAKLIASKTGGTYFAGIWLESWMQDLLWEPAGARARSLKPKPENHADHTTKPKSTMVRPSWSWLGFSGSVATGHILCGKGPRMSLTDPNSFESDEYRPLALLSQTRVTPPGSDPFSSFNQAILMIRCLTLPVRFAGSPHNKPQPWFFRHDYVIEDPSAGLDCMLLRASEAYHEMYPTFRFSFSKPVDSSLQYFLVPLYLRQNWEGEFGPCVYGLVVQRGLNGGNQEFIRIGMWYEDYRCTSQLSPMISNTIVNLGVGKKSAPKDGRLTEDEQVFDSNLHEYAAGHVESEVEFPQNLLGKVVKHYSDTEELDKKASATGYEDIEQKSPETVGQKGSYRRNEIVECSLLPHFTTAEWATISLV
ncbi:hypothetical protein FBEOM_721 [Fusarium beomiforme]|uniref:Heterokaryon incompatibility domain-containing protein n=1 Tax=Fusarium beomiforme TaxID=44412 RepID=A0A9P5AVJ4_9HYPO|nr:hypothetical protein FBEOM_721 [Fusarium beomiforme]